MNAGDMDATELLASLSSSDAVIEERIRQSSEMAAFHPGSINTVRVTCFACKDGRHITASVFRTGRGQSVVDNVGAGGIAAEIDVSSGIVVSCGLDENLGTYEKHPDTGTEFRGFRLPDWAGALDYVGKLMALVPECKCVGWDLAHTDDGWTVVEGNPFPSLTITQMSNGVGLTKEFERLVELA